VDRKTISIGAVALRRRVGGRRLHWRHTALRIAALLRMVAALLGRVAALLGRVAALLGRVAALLGMVAALLGRVFFFKRKKENFIRFSFWPERTHR